MLSLSYFAPALLTVVARRGRGSEVARKAAFRGVSFRPSSGIHRVSLTEILLFNRDYRKEVWADGRKFAKKLSRL